MYITSDDTLLFCPNCTLPYPQAANFLIERRHEIVRPQGAQVQLGGSGTRVPVGLRAALLRT
ncbi:hypothetical protein QMN58_33015, partial [Escherichia coli]|nr:hypothetical protein [Escherichia coli]